MRLVDKEKELKELVKENPQNPEIYNKIYDISCYYLRWKKLVFENDIDEVATIIAQDLYFKIYNGGEIQSWLGYINIYCRAAIRIWRKMNSSELIDTSSDYELKQGIVLMSMSGSISDDLDFQRIFDRLYFDNICNVVDNIMKISRYKENTKYYMNSRLSILLSLSASKFINYNLPESEKLYTRMLYNLSKDKIIEDIIVNNCEGNYSSSMSLMQLFTMSFVEEQY